MNRTAGRLVRALGCVAVGAALLPLAVHSSTPKAGGLRFNIRFGPEQSREAIDGRLLLLISNDESAEPRFQIDDGPRTQQLFGIDVEAMKPEQAALIEAGVLGYPRESLGEIPAGSYTVQALLHRYETFRRADGHVVKLPKAGVPKFT